MLLVAGSTLVAVAIGVPLGIFAARRPRLAAPMMAIASIVQTVPSLAMFGFLLPVPLVGGVGARAAVVVLILYGLLPIVRTTIAGLRGSCRGACALRRRRAPLARAPAVGATSIAIAPDVGRRGSRGRGRRAAVERRRRGAQGRRARRRLEELHRAVDSRRARRADA